jgi:hypothetical protein
MCNATLLANKKPGQSFVRTYKDKGTNMYDFISSNNKGIPLTTDQTLWGMKYKAKLMSFSVRFVNNNQIWNTEVFLARARLISFTISSLYPRQGPEGRG